MQAMSTPEWDPQDPGILENQIKAYDAMRAQCPVAHSDFLGYSVLTHAEALQVLHDPQTFSNAVSHRLTVPNGMDPPEHTEFRALNDRYFTPELMERFEPVCRDIAIELIDEMPRGRYFDVVESLAEIYALRVQSAFLGWPASLEEPLRAWTQKNRIATLKQDRPAMKVIAGQFDGYIRRLLEQRRSAGTEAPDDLTTRLMGEKVYDRVINDEELVSLLRNWTVGELGTIAASVGILVHQLGADPALTRTLREDPHLIGVANDEILRAHAPLIANRRVSTKDVQIEGHQIPAGERVTVVWASANRDESVFGDPDEIRLDRDPELNLLYGAGIHYCPGAPLARLELRVFVEELLARTTKLQAMSEMPASYAHFPGSGFATLLMSFG